MRCLVSGFVTAAEASWLALAELRMKSARPFRSSWTRQGWFGEVARSKVSRGSGREPCVLLCAIGRVAGLLR